MARWFDRLCLQFAVALLTVAIVVSSIQDRLLFHSDPLNALPLGLASAFALTLFFALVWEAARAIGGRGERRGWDLALARMPVVLILGGLAIFGAQLLSWRARNFVESASIPQFAGAMAAILFLSWGIVRLLPGEAEVRERVTTLARFLLPLGVVTLSGLVGYTRGLKPRAAAGEEKHLVFILLDGFPTQLFHTFNPETTPIAFDKLAESARIYDNAHTAAVWTHGYFATLYHGDPRWAFGSSAPSRGDLVGTLQQNGVRTRWITFHTNGIPEAQRLTDYAGLRSSFLTEQNIALPRLLGLDYNFFLYRRGSLRTSRLGPREKVIFDLINRPRLVDPFAEVALPEVRRLREGARRTFLSFHINFKMNQDPGLWVSQEEMAKVLPPGEAEAFARIAADENRFSARDADFVRQIEEGYRREGGAHLDAMLVPFFQAVRAEGLDRDAIFIVTADHGSIFQETRFLYGHHPQEEVTRVPFLLFGGKEPPGRVGRLLTTIDITRGIFDYFGIATHLHPRAVSFLDTDEEPAWAASITSRSPQHREWFLVLYRDGFKYQFNLDPAGDGAALKMLCHGYRCETLAKGKEAMREVREDLAVAMAEYGLGRKDLHRDFQGLLPDSLKGLEDEATAAME
ncbi:MAG: sulfatase-like hydrolase/transferase [Magnetococcales bacterium]|nr:sulfatase-like hydrolase/transferase [Magnetococcales bacterium]